MTLLDSRELASGVRFECEICIVGGGAAGIAMALALSQSSRDVILIESGGVNPDAATQALYEGENVGAPLLRNLVSKDIQSTRLRYLGGSTNHWAGWCRPFAPIDFEARDEIPLSGWPLSYDDLADWYLRAQEICRLGPFRYETEGFQHLGPLVVDTDEVETKMIQINQGARFGNTYLEDLRTAGNVRVLLWGNVVGIGTNETGSLVQRVDVATLSGVDYTVQAQKFVLATGGLEVPRMLLNATEARPAGLGNQNDLVGRYFTEHLQLPIAVAALNETREQLRLYDEPTFNDPDHPRRDLSVKGVMSLTEDVMTERGLLGLDGQFVFGVLPGDAPHQDTGVDVAAAGALLEAAERRRVETVGLIVAVGEQLLNRESRVTLSTTNRDALGVPEIVLDWRYGDQDRTSMLEGLSIMSGALAQVGLGRMQVVPGAMQPDLSGDVLGSLTQLVSVDPSAIDPDGFDMGIGNHHMCTTRMDPDPQKGVVDVDCKVHSVDNLYIAGSSVFPTGGVAPPTLTLVALALRLADHLKRALA